MSSSLYARVLGFLGLISLLAALPLATATPAVANHTIPLTLSITYVRNVDTSNDGIEDRTSGKADMYAGVTINGNQFNSFAGHPDDHDELGQAHLEQLNWIFSDSVPGETLSYPVRIEIWDHDDCDEAFCQDTGAIESDDDLGDVDPTAGSILDLNVTQDGKWTGDVSWPQNCAQGEGEDAVQVCWSISTDSLDGDADNDGLLDGWERFGYNDDGDTDIDVDLPGFGAKWDHQDIFLELDYSAGQTPGRDDIQAMQLAFSNAPRTNLDGVRGITLHVDTGTLVDPNAREGQAPNTCTDGLNNGNGTPQADAAIDTADPDCGNAPGNRQYFETSVEDPQPGNCTNNLDDDGDGLPDAQDLDCLVGDNLGGGNFLAPLNNCGVDTVFYDAKNGGGAFPTANFNPNRRFIFRYAISTIADQDTDGSGPTGGPDTGCGIGGQGELGGNDFIDYNNDGGTIMHELGHNLNLDHGGDDDSNCDPNYVSIMNYDLQFGIPRVNGGAMLDYSPPRINRNGSTRGNAPIGQLVEGSLDETVILDASDNANRFIFTNINPTTGIVQKNTTNLNVRPNWNGDTVSDGNPLTPDPPDTTDTGVQQNINDAGPPNAAGTRRPAACINGMNTETLDGHHDWNRVSVPFRQFGDSADSAINPETDPVPTNEDLDQMVAAINTADVGVTIADAPNPVGAGEQLTYTLTAGNHGPNPASSVQVRTTLPVDVTFVDASVPCVRTTNVVTCNVGELLVGATRSFTIRVDVPADLVYTNGGPKTITATATVDNLVGPDPNGSNDSASVDTLVITKADVKINAVTTMSPLEVLIGQQASATIDVTVENGGPSSPVDSELSGTASASPGLIVAPTGTTANQTALSKGTPQVVRQSFTLDCTTPGFKTVSFAYTLTFSLVTDPTAVDPDLSNNVATVSITIDCVVPIAINVRPKGFPNAINLNTDATLAALTTEAGEYGLPLAFDATTVDPLSVRWGVRSSVFNVGTVAGAQEIHHEGHLERSYELDERTRDADLDMVLHFKPADSGLTLGSTESCLKGSFQATDGNTYRFLGCDAVRVVR